MNIQIKRAPRGFSLIEVMIAVIVLAVGLLSLAALQGELFRSGAESKARANAATIAQQVIEDARSFAFLSAEAGYTGDTYAGLESDEWEVTAVGGVDFDVTRDVVRYRWDSVDEVFEEDAVTPYAVGVPEFKLVRVAVSWTDSLGDPKAIQMTDSIAAISPSDVAKVMKGPSEASRGPEFWIVPPNKGNPRVVPIAVGNDQSSASSNPTPEQFIEDASAVTRFSVLSFKGSTTADEVQLTRRLDMAAASCVCNKAPDQSSSAANPSYGPTIWNGIQLAYEEPAVMPVGTPIGIAEVGNDSEIEPICTVCCRDHLVTEGRTPDPYRTEIDDTIADRYTYKPSGGGFDFGVPPTLYNADEYDGQYLDSCQLTRVNGRMRTMVDAQQASLVTTSLNSLESGYRNTGFGDSYSSYVQNYLVAALDGGSMPDGYPSPDVRFPAPSSAFSDTPDPIEFAEGDTVRLVSFGLYVDYLSEDTLLAYKCALENDNEDDCAGLGTRDDLSVIPFYAVNVASLGAWSTPTGQTVATVSSPEYKSGQLVDAGGLVSAGKGASEEEDDGTLIPTAVTLAIKNSNTGLAGTLPFDPDDALEANEETIDKGFVKGEGADAVETRVLTIDIVSGPLDFKTMSVAFGLGCDRKNAQATCSFEVPQSGNSSLLFSNYVGETNKKPPEPIDRKICVPTDAKIGVSPVLASSGTTGENVTYTLTNLGSTNYTMQIAIVGELESCPVGLTMTVN